MPAIQDLPGWWASWLCLHTPRISTNHLCAHTPLLFCLCLPKHRRFPFLFQGLKSLQRALYRKMITTFEFLGDLNFWERGSHHILSQWVGGWLQHTSSPACLSSTTASCQALEAKTPSCSFFSLPGHLLGAWDPRSQLFCSFPHKNWMGWGNNKLNVYKALPMAQQEFTPTTYHTPHMMAGAQHLGPSLTHTGIPSAVPHDFAHLYRLPAASLHTAEGTVLLHTPEHILSSANLFRGGGRKIGAGNTEGHLEEAC